MRYLIVGNSGSGKSTLAMRLAARDRLAHLDLDTLAWLPGAKRRPFDDSARDIRAFLDANTDWVIEGCYARLIACVPAEGVTLVLLDIDIEECVENARQRPWEPHKYEAKDVQDARLEALIAWIRGYEKRTDELSRTAHRALFDAFPGAKIELRSREAIDELAR